MLVGLYRYFFYQHRLDDALVVAERAMQISARHLGLPPDWNLLDETSLGKAAANSFGLLRFYLLALKAASVVLLRLGADFRIACAPDQAGRARQSRPARRRKITGSCRRVPGQCQ